MKSIPGNVETTAYGTRFMIRTTLFFLTGLLLVLGPALAQGPSEGPTYNFKPRTTMIEWLIGTIFLVGCLVVAFKPSKRSNLK